MNRGVEFAVGADERVGADGDASLVEEGAVRVDVDLLAEADAESVVAEEGGDKYRRGGPVGNEFREGLRVTDRVEPGGGVQFLELARASGSAGSPRGR